MAFTEKQEKAIKSVERALNKAGRAGLQGGVYDGEFMIMLACEDRGLIVKEICAGYTENGVDLYTPNIILDGGAGV